MMKRAALVLLGMSLLLPAFLLWCLTWALIQIAERINDK